MSPAENERVLIERYRLIEDPQERLAAVMSLGKKQPAWPEIERSEERRVQGCASRVWVAGTVAEGGLCHFRVEGDSALVKGLATLLCAVYQGATLAEVVEYETSVLEALHLSDHLSPTRRHGLQQVGRKVREWARDEALRRA